MIMRDGWVSCCGAIFIAAVTSASCGGESTSKPPHGGGHAGESPTTQDTGGQTGVGGHAGEGATAGATGDPPGVGGEAAATNTGGTGSVLPTCTPSVLAPPDCDTLMLDMPPPVVMRADDGPWDTTLSGTMVPGTYVLTDLAKHGDPPKCSRSVAAMYIFGADGYASEGWNEGGAEERFSGPYKDGPVDGTLVMDVDCPANTGDRGLPFHMTETGFTITNNDGTVMTFTRQ